MKPFILPLATAVLFIGGAVIFTQILTPSADPPSGSGMIVDGKQIIEIQAKGGYNPKLVVAKANVPTVIRVKTQGTFDCSSALSIPSLGYRKNLEPSGLTDIEVPAQKPGSKIEGLCAMGMYNFAVNFN